VLIILSIERIILSSTTKIITHPIIFITVIIFQALLVCLFSSLCVSTPWIALVLFLIFLGGVIVLFIYISSLASNENFLWLTKELIFSSAPVLFIAIFIFLVYPSFKNILNNMPESILYQLYSFKFLLLFLTFILYLLVTLLIVSNIAKKNKSPMRSFK